MSKRPKATASRRKVFLVDNHPVLRRGLAELIKGEPDLVVSGEADSAESAVTSLVRRPADLVIAEISLPGADGIDGIRMLRKAGVKAPVLILTMHEEETHAERALRAGARGFIMKYRAMADLLGAIRCVLEGRLYLSPEMSERVAKGGGRTGKTGIDALSARERQVLELLGRGVGTRNVAQRLRLSVKTVQTYRAKIMDKLHLGGAAQLVRRAVQWVEHQQESAGRRSRRGARGAS